MLLRSLFEVHRNHRNHRNQSFMKKLLDFNLQLLPVVGVLNPTQPPNSLPKMVIYSLTTFKCKKRPRVAHYAQSKIQHTRLRGSQSKRIVKLLIN
jgi:hypothetical protein